MVALGKDQGEYSITKLCPVRSPRSLSSCMNVFTLIAITCGGVFLYVNCNTFCAVKNFLPGFYLWLERPFLIVWVFMAMWPYYCVLCVHKSP